MRILGVDPGTLKLGFGCIEVSGRQLRSVTHGIIKLNPKDALEDRLKILFQELCKVVEACNPDALIVERVFFAKNALSALKLGHARGVVLLVAALNQLKVSEVTPAEVKKIIAGSGAADKQQVAKMVELILGKQSFQSFDASDALALALCFVYQQTSQKTAATQLPKKSRKQRSLAQSLAHRINR